MVTKFKGTSLENLPITSPKKSGWYEYFSIPKRSGGKRIIEAPVDWLKQAQRKIYFEVLLKKCAVSAQAYGCVMAKNVQKAAEPHLGAKYILKMDIKDCFSSITKKMVYDGLRFNGIPEADATVISDVCTNSRDVLPQGAPTSPSLANIVLIKAYAAINILAGRMGCTFTGYLDDLIFSGDRALEAVNPITKILKYYGLTVNPEKISRMRRKKEVLCVCVAGGINNTRLPKRMRNQIRGRIHRLEMFLREQNPTTTAAQAAIWKKRIFRSSGPTFEEFFQKTAGLVAFAEMTKDQKAPLFKESMRALRVQLGITASPTVDVPFGTDTAVQGTDY